MDLYHCVVEYRFLVRRKEELSQEHWEYNAYVAHEPLYLAGADSTAVMSFLCNERLDADFETAGIDCGMAVCI